MAKIKFYLDTRATRNGDGSPLKIKITSHGVGAFINLDIRLLPNQWNKEKEKIVNHNQKDSLNLHIQKRKIEVEEFVRGCPHVMNGKQIKDALLIKEQEGGKWETRNMFLNRFLALADKKTPQTRGNYIQVINSLKKFDGYLHLRTLDDITRDYLQRYESFLRKNKVSSNTIYSRFVKIKAVFNDAIDDGLIVPLPFRKNPIKQEETRKRSIAVDKLRELLLCEPYEEKLRFFLAMAKMIVFLRGINTADLAHLKKESIVNGRIEYRRQKTKRLYSILIEPEIQEIIDEYSMKDGDYLFNLLPKFETIKKVNANINENLRKLGTTKLTHKAHRTGKPIIPKITSYWLRHSWATVASEMDFPKEVISEGLGHKFGNTVTDIYINFDQKKVDDANRRLIDYILYNKV